MDKVFSKRIDSLDGFRALAALGVLYIHCWSSFGSPKMSVFNMNMAIPLAIGGNGVDLFFAISGFIMYFIYGGKGVNPSGFTIKRWKRLSPAFYTASAVYILIALIKNDNFAAFKSLFTSFFYLNNIIPIYSSAALLWTLSVEWQFYLVFALFIIIERRNSFWISISLFSIVFILIPVLITILLKSESDVYTNQIFFRFFEFMSGMIAANIYLKNRDKNILTSVPFIAGISIVFFGRYFTTSYALSKFVHYASLFKLFAYIIMGMGFSIIIYVGLKSKWLSIIFKLTKLPALGRISYSFYLWHGAILMLVFPYVSRHQLSSSAKVLITFTVATLINLLISKLSYRYLEKPFV